MSEQERMERRAKNLQWQVDYMCSEIAKVAEMRIDSPTEAVDMVRALKMYADVRDEKIARVRALLHEWDRLGRGDGVHGQQLRAALEGQDTQT